MDKEVFDLFMSRFDSIEATNKQFLDLVGKHVEADNKVHAVVERHSTYWKFLFMGIPLLSGAVATKLGWK